MYFDHWGLWDLLSSTKITRTEYDTCDITYSCLCLSCGRKNTVPVPQKTCFFLQGRFAEMWLGGGNVFTMFHPATWGKSFTHIHTFFGANRIHGSVGTVKQQPTNTNQPVSESWILLGIFQGGKVIFCMTSEVSGNHIVTNSTNTSWQSWRYLKTPFLFIPSQNGWWSCPSRTWGDPLFIYINNLYFKDLIILSLQPVCSDLFLYIYIYSLFFWTIGEDSSRNLCREWTLGAEVSSVAAPPWRCCAAGKMTILLLVGRLEEGNQFKRSRCYLSHRIHVWCIYLHLVVFNGKIW